MGGEGTAFLMIPIPQNKNRQALILSLTVFTCHRITSF